MEYKKRIVDDLLYLKLESFGATLRTFLTIIIL